MPFGTFDTICKTAPYPLCPLVGGNSNNNSYMNGPECYSRSVDFGNNVLLFQPSTLVMEIISFIMTLVIVYSVKTKYTAVGRKEMLLFFYMYLVQIVLEFLVLSGLIKYQTKPYLYFVSLHNASITAVLFCLMLTGFVGFQFHEDGTRKSTWTFKGSTFLVGGIVFMLNVLTFLDLGGLRKSYPIAIFVVYYIFNPILILVYFVMQSVLVTNTLDELWPLGNIILGLLLFVVGQLIVLFLSSSICSALSHYVDGMFFGCICSLLSVMMVYKYWDTITKEDLEFCVGNNNNIWEVEDLIKPNLKNNNNNNNNNLYANYTDSDGYIDPTTHSVMNRSSVVYGSDHTNQP